MERDNLIFKFKSKPKQFRIYLENVGKTASLTTNITHSKVNIPGLFKGWITIELDQFPEDKIIKMYAENVRKPRRIQGFKLNNNQNTFYPWNQGFQFEKKQY